jgi:carbonic anhydrase/acetyltransferase-like protein (isoleucine patch superfamily)
LIYQLGDKKPTYSADSCYIAPSADVIGDVTLMRDTSIWFGAILRGDNDSILIGQGTNIQDGSVIHVDSGFPVSVGENVTIGHRVVLHGCTVENSTLIGMNAVILNGAIIGENSLVGANALITEGTVVPANSVVLGSPGRVVRQVNRDEVIANQEIAARYVDKSHQYATSLILVTEA